MKISSRFTIAAHILLAIYKFGGSQKTTSEFLAASVNVNPVVIRRILLSLKAAGVVEVKAGSGGASLARPAEEITLYDLYKAVDCVEGDGGELFRFHDAPNPECPVGRNIHAVLDEKLEKAQKALEDELKAVTIADLEQDLDNRIG